MIGHFIKKFHVNMADAEIENIDEFDSFNTFFIRKLKPSLRPITHNTRVVVSPVDGAVRQAGTVEHGNIINAKGHGFSVYTLLGGNFERCAPFLQGSFINLYLAPCDYHRVHMPYAGTLKSMTYIPGKLFSVKESSVNAIPSLFSKNERLVLMFDTAIGPMAVVLVGAMIVGSMQTVWHGDIQREKKIREWHYDPSLFHFNAGDEIGHFKLGSTVIVFFSHHHCAVEWTTGEQKLHYGQKIGDISFLGS